MVKRMTVPGEIIPEEESENTDGIDIDSMGDISESSPAILSPAIVPTDYGILPPSPTHARSYGKFKKEKVSGAPYKGYTGEGVV